MIRPEAALIKILLELDVYNKYRSFIDVQDDKELKLLYAFLDKVMERYQRDVSFDEYSVVVLGSITQDKPVIAKILDVIREASVDKEVAEELLIQARERKQAHDLALLAIAVTEGKKTLADLKEALDTQEVTKQEISDDKFVSDDLEVLYEGFVQKQGLRWRLQSLNRMLGSLRRGNFGFIFARPESYSRDTEVLTPTGWLNVDKVTTETEIAQVDSNLNLSFVCPSAVHPHEQEYCYHIQDTLGRVDLIVTEGHGMVVEKDGILQKERADSVVYKQGIKHHVAAKTVAQSRNLNDMERLAIALSRWPYQKL